MVKATFVKQADNGEGKSIMIAVKMNARSTKATCAYVAAVEGDESLTKGDVVELDEGFTFATRTNDEGELMTYKDGEPVLFLEW